MEKIYRILYIEDDPIDLMAFKKFAVKNQSGLNFVFTNTALEAQTILSKTSFDLIVTDYNLQHIKATDLISKFSDTPFIIMTGQGNEEIAIKALKAGASDYIIKDPMSNYFKTIYLAIERALNSHHQSLELNRYREHLEEIIIEKTKELEQTNKLFKQLIDNLPVMVFQITIFSETSYKFKYASSGAGTLFNFAPESIENNHNDFLELFHQDDRLLFEMRLFKSAKTIKPWNLELRANISNNKRWFQCYCKPEFDRTGVTIVYGVFVESTDYKIAEEKVNLYQSQLRQLVSQLSNVEERERRKIATDLHDRIGQSLALAKLKIKSLQNKYATTPLAAELDDIVLLVQNAISDTRGLISDLSPSILYELGIVAAIEWLSEKMSLQHKLKIKVSSVKMIEIRNDDIKAFLYRVAHELLINAVKHSKASEVLITLSTNFAETTLVVKDNGVGFNPMELSNHDNKECFGLFSIKERLNYFGGKIEITSQPNNGTTVSVTVMNWIAANLKE